MIITLYKSTADPAELDKTTKIAQVMELEGYLRDDCSLLRPRFRVQIVNLTADSLDFNYVYIPLFKRYYYVREIIACHNGEIEVYCEEDCLMSFKDDIKELEVFIERCNYVGAPVLIHDSDLPILQTEKCVIINGSNYNPIFDTITADSGITFMMTSSSYLNHSLIEPASGIEYLYPQNLLNDLSGNTYLYMGDVWAVLKSIMGKLDANNLLHFYNIPIIKEALDYSFSSVENIYLGEESVPIDTQLYLIENIIKLKNNYSSQRILFGLSNIDGLTVSQILANNTTIELYVPYYGYIEVPKSSLYTLGNNIYCQIIIEHLIDFSSGDITYLFRLANPETFEAINGYFNSVTVNMMTEYTWLKSNKELVEARRLANSWNVATKLINTVDSGAKSLISGNTNGAIISTVTGVVDTITTYNAQEATNIQFSEPVKANSKYNIMALSNKPHLKITFNPSYVDLNTYKLLHGSIYRNYGVIKNFNGYLQVGDIHPENIGSASIEEIRSIVTLLQKGIKV